MHGHEPCGCEACREHDLSREQYEARQRALDAATPRITLAEMRADPDRTQQLASQPGGVIITNNDGTTAFTLSIPSAELKCDCDDARIADGTAPGNERSPPVATAWTGLALAELPSAKPCALRFAPGRWCTRDDKHDGDCDGPPAREHAATTERVTHQREVVRGGTQDTTTETKP